MKKYLLILFLIVFIIPSIAFASWWNPFSWFNSWTFHKTETIPQEQVEIQKTSEEKISELQKQVDDLKNQKLNSDSPPVVNNTQKKSTTKENNTNIVSSVKITPEVVTTASPVFDVCKNIEGVQSIAPDGMQANNGNCSKVDLCPFMAGDQFTLPYGMLRDPDGTCYSRGEDFCPNIEKLQKNVPEGYIREWPLGETDWSLASCVKISAPTPLEPIQINDSGVIECYVSTLSPASAGLTPRYGINCRNTYEKTSAFLKQVIFTSPAYSYPNYNTSMIVKEDDFPVYTGTGGPDTVVNLSGKINANTTNKQILELTGGYYLDRDNIFIKSLVYQLNGKEKTINF